MWLKSWFKQTLGITFELSAKDIVVFMVGPSGGGKSWFITAVTKSGHVKVGADLKPCTKEVRAIRCELTDQSRAAIGASEEQKYIVLVDTPSFLTGARNEEAAEKNMEQWLKEAKSRSALIGAIYVDRVAEVHVRKTTTVQEHLNRFAYTFPGPQDFELSEFSLPLRLRGILSYDSGEGVIREDRITSRMEMFMQQLQAVDPSLFHGRGKLMWCTSCHLECLRRDKPEEAWNAVVELFCRSSQG